MKAIPRLEPGTHFIEGNMALAEGAIAAGCRFMAGYPITPASEIPNRLSQLLPGCGGVFLQTEDEIAAVCSTIGASWSGLKAMTATSGPGISLMQENIGMAAATETPLVIVDVMRFGPSTGVPSVGLAGDVVQVARGSHGDYQIIALCPESPQDMFDHMIRAFNLAEGLRCPVFVLADGFMGHMREQVNIPPDDQISLVDRKLSQAGTDPEQRRDFLDPDVAPMPVFGQGLKAHVTSSCHNGQGMRNLTDPEVMHAYVTNPIEKVRHRRQEVVEVQADYAEGDLVLVSYGTVARSAKAAAQAGRAQGLNIGTLSLKTLWPFPDEEVAQAAQKARAILVLENNMGQLFPYIKAASAEFCPVQFLGPRLLGQIHDPANVLTKIKEMLS
ncbi:MAG: 2-oxoacid:acceptor oxidoreductase subunit alpha [Desulfarculaceae bacterium]|jgi:2-oxoglutarate ferredoxin oxidoreductase subunit alpha